MPHCTQGICTPTDLVQEIAESPWDLGHVILQLSFRHFCTQGAHTQDRLGTANINVSSCIGMMFMWSRCCNEVSADADVLSHYLTNIIRETVIVVYDYDGTFAIAAEAICRRALACNMLPGALYAKVVFEAGRLLLCDLPTT